MLEDSVIDYKNQQDQKIYNFLQKVMSLQDDSKSKIYLIPPFLPQQLGKFNLATNSQEIGFSSVRQKHEFFNSLKEHFGQEEVNIHDIVAIQSNISGVTVEHSSESLKAKIILSDLVTDKSIYSQWNEKLEGSVRENKKQKTEEYSSQKKEVSNADSPLMEQEKFKEFCNLSEAEFEQFMRSMPEQLTTKIIRNAVSNLRHPSRIISSASVGQPFQDQNTVKQINS